MSVDVANPSAQDLVQLEASVQNYAWGLAPTRNSLVARLHALNTGNPVDDTKPYAELWMGIHPSGPARLAAHSDKITLQQFLDDAGLPTLPYLFKVLSVAKPLSIQAHPHKELAAKLHASNPKAYKDDNHKPEMCVALTDFEGMCNFRLVNEIHAHLSEFNDLANLCGGIPTIEAMSTVSTADDSKAALRLAFSSMMGADSGAVEAALESTSAIVETKGSPTAADRLFQRLCRFYPGDVGCFSAYLLNFVKIKAGQAFFMAANEPHAYLQGQCMEIMANSDNVVRAGLTPKFKDVDNLVSMLTYNDGAPDIMPGDSKDQYTTVYQPPADEFQLTRYILPAGAEHTLDPATDTGLILCIGGSGWIRTVSKGDEPATKHPLAPGSLYYVPKDASLEVEADPSAVDGAPSPDLYFFRAGVNEKQ